MADERDEYLKWREADKVERGATTQADDYNAWRETQRDSAAQKALLAIESAKPAPGAVAAIGRASDATQMGYELPADLLTDDASELTKRVERNTRMQQLRASSKLAEWVAEDPINAALAQSELRSLSTLGGLLQSTAKVGDRVTRGSFYKVKADRAVATLDELQTVRADKTRSFGGIVDDLKDEIDTTNVDANPLYTVTKTYAKALSRFASSRLMFAGDEQLDAYEKELSGYVDKALAERSGYLEKLERDYGMSARVARGRQTIQDIGELEGVGAQLSGLGEFIVNDPGAFSEWMANVLIDSSPGLVAGAVATRVTGSPAAGATAMGLTSYSMSSSSAYDQFVREAGYDLRDPEQRAAFVNDPAARRKMKDRAFAYGAVVGIIDAASGGVAASTLAKNVYGEHILQAVTQAVMGSSGELLGQLASGQDINIIEVAIEGLAEFATAPLEATFVGGRYLQNLRSARQDQQFFEALATSAAGSDMRKKVPAKYREAVAKLTADGPLETLFVDAQGLDELFQSDPEGVTAEQFLSAVPNVDIAAFRRALTDGGVVEIPTASYASDIAGTRFDELVRDHLRTKPENMSAAELRAYRAQLEELSAQAQQAAEASESGQTELEKSAETARVELVSALRRAGRAPDIAEREALQAVAFARTLSARLGITMDAFLQRYPLAQVQGVLEASGGQVSRVTADAMARARSGDVNDPLATVLRGAAEAAGLDLATAEPAELEAAVEQVYGPAAGPVLLNQIGAPTVTGLDGAITPDFLRSDGWGVVTAARGVEADAEQNAALEAELRERGIQFKTMSGMYKGTPDGTSYMIFADAATVRELGAKYGQESVLTNEGLVYMDGSPSTALDPDDLAIGDDATAREFYSVMDDGTAWSAGFAEELTQGPVYDRAKIEARAAELAAEMQPLAGAPRVQGATGPDPMLVAVAEAYAEANGISYRRQAEFVEVDAERGERIAAAFEAMPATPDQKLTQAAYKQLIEQTRAQYDALVAAGYVFWFFDPNNDPYKGNPWGAMRDLRANRSMGVYPTDDGFGTSDLDVSQNPLLADTGLEWAYGTPDGETRPVTANDLFRAVHDAFGHGVEGAGFRARGEENAWQAHVRLFKGWAIAALTTETRGQNSWLNYGPHGEANRTAAVDETVFADQKAGLLPEWVWKEGIAEDEIPTVPVNGDGTVTLVHWSDEVRDTIDPAQAGTGPLRGVERNRRGPNKAFYGVSVGRPGGYRKENLGPIRHEVRVAARDLYDLARDPDGIVGRIPDDLPAAQRVGWVEEQIAAAGFRGYVVTNSSQGATAALFDAATPDSVRDDRTVELFQSGAQPDFFSALTQQVALAKQKSATAKDWKAIIGKLPGIKKAEIEWSGVYDWLDTQEGQVARETVAAFLRNNEVEVETLLRGGGDSSFEIYEDGYDTKDPDYAWLATETEEQLEFLREQFVDKMNDPTNEDFEGTDWTVADIPEADAEVLEERAHDNAYDAYYESADLEYRFTITDEEGDYRTEVVTRSGTDGSYEWEGDTYRNEDELHEAFRERYSTVGEGFVGEASWGEWVEDGGENYREILLTVPFLEDRGPNALRERVQPFVNKNHYDNPNIVVHARVNDRRAADGSRVLFVEEVQSDLGSFWRGKEVPTREQLRRLEAARIAYEDATNAQVEARAALWDEVERIAALPGTRLDTEKTSNAARQLHDLWVYRYAPSDSVERADQEFYATGPAAAQRRLLDAALPQRGDAEFDAVLGRYQELNEAHEAAVARGNEAAAELSRARDKTRNSQPMTPFEGEAYYALMMKRLLKMAAEQGADKLAWTPAYMQARRWSGAVQNVINEIRWSGDATAEFDTETSSVADLRASLATRAEAQRVLIDAMRDEVMREGGIPEAARGAVRVESTSYDVAEFVLSEDETVEPDPADYSTTFVAAVPVFRAALARLRDQAAPAAVTFDEAAASALTAAKTYSERTRTTVRTREVVLDGVNGTDVISVRTDTGEVVSGAIGKENVQGQKLADILGGTMAQRILGEPTGTIEKQNIVVGGDGYVISYDQQIKKFVEKFAKRYGSKVTVDATMPDFARDTVSDPVVHAIESVGAAEVLRRLQARPDHDAEAFAVARRDFIAAREAFVTDARQTIARRQLQLDADRKSLIDAWAEQGRPVPERELAALDHRQSNLARDSALLDDMDGTNDRFDGESEKLADASFVRALHSKGYDVQGVLTADELPQGDAVWSVDITDKMREAASQAQPLFQRRPDGARGSILLPTEPGRAPLVSLFPKADLSTFLHESGHYYLHVLQDIIAQGDAPEGLAKDWDTIRNWWAGNIEGIAKDGGVSQDQVAVYLRDGTTGDMDIDRKVNVGLQEQWARGYEQYLLEGKSPSLALRTAFEAFSAWLLSVYRGVRGTNVEINDELRGVFDRLLATDEEIASASADSNMGELVARSAEALGVTEEEYQRLVELSNEARDEARQQMLLDVMAPVRRARTAEYREERAKVEAEVRDKVNAKPANRVREWLGNERWLGAGDEDPNPRKLPLDLRINRQSVIDNYGREVLDALPRGSRPLTTSETTLTADDVAGWFGYRSGSEMLDDVTTSPRAEDEIKARTDAEMRSRYGDPLGDGSIEESAVKALHGEKRGQLLAAELRAIGKTARKGKTTTRSQAREIARRTIRALPIAKAVRSGQYLMAERRAGERAAQAVARGDMDEAYQAKREQLLNHQLYMESKAADEVLSKVEKRVAKLKKKSVRKNLAGEYLEAIDDILTSYDFRKSVTQRQAQRRAGLVAYVEMMKAAGRENELAIPAYVLDEARRRPYKTLPVNELEGVLDSLRNIEHTARMKQKLRDAQRERDLTATVEGVTAEMEANLKDNAPNRVATPGERARGGLREFANLLLNADTLLRKIGGFEMGAAYDAIKAPIDAAADMASVMRAEAAEAFEQLYSVYSRGDRRRMATRVFYKELGGSFTKWDLISAALNMGNAENLSRLMDKDSGAGFTAEQVDFIKAKLDARDWAFVQSSWDYINSFWPLIEARERRLTGTAPKKVQATEVDTPYGTFDGGYYPIRYRGDISGMVASEELAEVQQRMMAGRFGKAQTRAGHLEERAMGSGGRVLQLGMEVMHQHVGQVIHDLAFSEAVSNTWRVLQDPRVRGMFERKGLLKDHQALELWVQDTATGQLAAGGVFGRLALKAKNGFTLSKLAFNLSTVAIQLTGIAQSMVVIGAKDMAVGYSTYLSNPMRTSAELVEMSPFMRERETTFNRDINDILGDVMVGPAASRSKRFQQGIARVGFWLMQKVQFYGVDVPTWYGAYAQGLRKFATEEKARAYADRMVARAQASGVVSDRSAFERGTLSADTRQNGFVRLFTALGSYMFAKGNVAYEVMGRTRRDVDGFNAKSFGAALKGAADMTMLFTIEAIAYNLIKGTLPGMGDDDEESWALFLAKETALSMMSTIPGVRDLGSSLSGFEAGAYGSILETMTKPVIQGAQGEADIALFKALSGALGVATGLPSGQLNRTVDAWYRLEEGEDVAPVEFIMGRR